MVFGAIAILKENSGNFLLWNPELEKVICRRREAYLQESDLIELLDGNAMGRASSQDRTVGKLWCAAWHLLAGDEWRQLCKAAIAANIPR